MRWGGAFEKVPLSPPQNFLFQVDPLADFRGFDDCVQQAFVDDPRVNVRVQAVVAAVQDVREGLHLVDAHFLRDFYRDVLSTRGCVRDFQFVDTGDAVEVVDECALFAVDLHPLIVPAAVGEAADLERGGDAVRHFGEDVREVVDVHLADFVRTGDFPFVDDRAEVGDNGGVFLSRDKRNEVKAVTAEVTERTGRGNALDVTPHERAARVAQTPRLIVLHTDVVDFAEPPRQKETAEVTRGGFVAVREVNHALDAGFVGDFGELERFGGVHRDGFFHAVRFACPCGGRGNFEMDVVRGGDVHGIDVGTSYEIMVIGEAVILGDSVGFRAFHETVFVNVAEGGQFQVGRTADAGDVNTAGDASESDRANSINSHKCHPFMKFRTEDVALILSYFYPKCKDELRIPGADFGKTQYFLKERESLKNLQEVCFFHLTDAL